MEAKEHPGNVTVQGAFLDERRGEPCRSGRRDVDSRGGCLKIRCAEPRGAVFQEWLWICKRALNRDAGGWMKCLGAAADHRGEFVGQVCGHRKARGWKQAGRNREFLSGETGCCGETRHTSAVAAGTACGL